MIYLKYDTDTDVVVSSGSVIVNKGDTITFEIYSNDTLLETIEVINVSDYIQRYNEFNITCTQQIGQYEYTLIVQDVAISLGVMRVDDANDDVFN